MLNKSGKSRHSPPVLYLRWNPFSFSLLSVLLAFIVLRYVSTDTHFIENFNYEWMLSFVRSFFFTYWDDGMNFILCFFNMMYHIDWFEDVKPSLHPWNKSHLIMVYGVWYVVYDSFTVLLNLACWYFVEDFCFCFYQWYWPVISFFSWCLGCDIRVMLAFKNEFESVPLSSIFLGG